MFRNLIPLLADRYHVIAPDYPGFGESAAPDHDKFKYTFAHITELMDGLLQKKGVKRYVLYSMDYGGPVSYRLALLHPERVSGLIIQNGNAYEGGLLEFWDPIKEYWKDRFGAEPSEERNYAKQQIGGKLGTNAPARHVPGQSIENA